VFLDALLRSLPDSEREVLILFFFGNLSQRDVGLRLGQSQMTVSRTKERALQRLRSRVTAAA
jgi:RNA polymerase sigma-B factor